MRGRFRLGRVRVVRVTDFPPSHQFLRFMTPLNQQRADRLIDFLTEGLTGEVLEVGCG